MKKQNVRESIEYSDEKFTKRIIFKEKESTAFVLNFKPGQTLPDHKHPGSSVYLYVLLGEGEFSIDGEKVAVVKDDVLLSTGEEEMGFINNSSANVSLYVLLTKIPNEQYAKNI